MSENKNTILKYMDGFEKSDHAQILSCLTEDVVWLIPGIFRKTGKKEFDGEIEDENFIGSPTIKIHRMFEDTDVVIVEGNVIGKMVSGDQLDASFCDVFEFENGKIKQLTSYLMNN
ncbi:MAG: nuclear transport factor 2 family protein [Gelidibacter sp.]